MDLTLQLTDDYIARNSMLSQLLRDSNAWFELALGRAPVELHATLQVHDLHFVMLSVFIRY
jgi:phosphatidylinositol 4-kinase A